MDQQSWSMVRLVIIVLLPVIPAFLLFVALPSHAVVSGPLKGFKINLSGAFGAYFALLLVVISTRSVWDAAPNYTIWTVDGNVVQDDGTPVRLLQARDISLSPPIISMDGAGGFSIQIVSSVDPNGRPTYPSLTLESDGYFPVPIKLDPLDGASSAKDLGMSWNRSAKRIKITRIMLHAMPPYRPDGAPPTPVPGTEVNK